MKVLIKAIAIFFSLGLALPAMAEEGVKDTEIGVRKVNVLDIPPIPLFHQKAEDAGDNELLPRSFEGAPPQVPHLITDMEINRGANDCTDCHTSDKESEDPAISETHFLKDAETLSGRRHFCTTCHVTQQDAKPLVKNTFDNE